MKFISQTLTATVLGVPVSHNDRVGSNPFTWAEDANRLIALNSWFNPIDFATNTIEAESNVQNQADANETLEDPDWTPPEVTTTTVSTSTTTALTTESSTTNTDDTDTSADEPWSINFLTSYKPGMNTLIDEESGDPEWTSEYTTTTTATSSTLEPTTTLSSTTTTASTTTSSFSDVDWTPAGTTTHTVEETQTTTTKAPSISISETTGSSTYIYNETDIDDDDYYISTRGIIIDQEIDLLGEVEQICEWYHYITKPIECGILSWLF